ncbi:MAG: MBL fold metallo-hydrolase [Solirubrobacteraceae bacterium]
MSDEASLQAFVYTSPFHEIAETRRTFSPTTSTLLVGETDAVLVDAQHIRSDVAALGDLIEQTGKNLTTIYITHGHADHWFGIGELLARFPGARPLATKGVVEYIEQTTELAKGQWAAMFGDAVVAPTVVPEPLEGDLIDLEGHDLRVVAVPQGDIRPSTVLHVPVIDTVVAGDVIYNQIHLMLGLTGRDEWKRWIESVEQVEQLGAKRVIAGHKKPDASDAAVAEMLEGTRSYIKDFGQATNDAEDADALVAAMTAKYADYGNPWTLAFSAQAYFSKR